MPASANQKCAFASAVIGVMALAASLHGYLFGPLSVWQRAVLFVPAILLIAPELISSLIGIVLLGAVAIHQGMLKRFRPAAGLAAK